MAIAAAQTRLTAPGAAASDLGALVRDALDIHAGSTGRVAIDGPRVTVDAETSLGLALVLHELATNAVKYGALSNETGRVGISWTPGGGGQYVDLVWRERGGPPVVPPSRHGFGSSLIRKSLPPYPDSEPSIDYEPDGLVFRARMACAAPTPGG